ncbi:MAG: hypothetical protein LBT06_07440 [Hungatella sp.]|nr:hypothetical protein [Hungatella sp.]
MVVENEQDLGSAIDNEEETIRVKGRLAPRIKKIWYLDRFLWCVCLACLAVAVAALLAAPTTFGTSAVMSMVAGTPAAFVMGAPAASTAVLMAAAGSGISTLRQLRNGYWLEVISSEYVVLYKK